MQRETCDGRRLVIVVCPPPRASSEAYFVGIVLPSDETVEAKAASPGGAIRFFVLSKWPLGGRRTDFCEWTSPTRELTYNVGSEPWPDAFAEMIEEYLTRRTGA